MDMEEVSRRNPKVDVSTLDFDAIWEIKVTIGFNEAYLHRDFKRSIDFRKNIVGLLPTIIWFGCFKGRKKEESSWESSFMPT